MFTHKNQQFHRLHNKGSHTCKKTVFSALAVLCASCIMGCGEKAPAFAADGSTWDQNWTMLGSVLGVEELDNGFSILENPMVLAGDDMHYATWSTGEPTAYVNEDGEETDLYEAEIYCLAMGVQGDGTAEKTIADWMDAESETYQVQDISEQTINGQDYTLLTYTVDSESNPNNRGVTAFTIFGQYCITAEITCLEQYSGDEMSILTDFLTHCHYNADLSQQD
ncbi:MAG: hypothetical protein Q4B85_02180 [Lachnospiraceae bacterium]|nr:hypothetical protein [Lachnospiraceae bacterium]